MQSAIKKHYQRNCSLEGLNFENFFKPHNGISTITTLGADVMPGVNRRPVFLNSPDLLRQIRIVVWKAAKVWQLSDCNTKFGEAFFIKSRAPSMWNPDSVVWLYKTLDERKQEKLRQDKLASMPLHVDRDVSCLLSGPSASVSAPVASAPVVNKNGLDTKSNRVINEKQPTCFYGHTTTSAYRRGKPTWHVSPVPPWPSVPPDRPLCQKCYQVHRTAALKGKSQYDFPHLYLYATKHVSVSTVRPPDVGGASSSSSTTRPPD
jgi:hypothetical protein